MNINPIRNIDSINKFHRYLYDFPYAHSNGDEIFYSLNTLL